jgi:probable HAF family extracellular repeat protein
LTSITAMMLFAALAMPVRPQAQEQSEPEQPATQERKPKRVRYTVTDLGALGGSVSVAFGVNNRGDVGGGATLLDGNLHAFLWYRGHMKDLRTLGGPNSEAAGPNARGEAAIVSETSTPDTNGEDFCGFGTHLQCLGAIWKKGAMTALPTLGGNNAQALGLNNRGQVFGYAENGNGEKAGYCTTPFQVLDFEAVIWEPNGEVHELPPLPGDTVGIALGISGNGQVAGSSGLCSNTTVTGLIGGPHAVLWQKDGSATDLGNLGVPNGPNVAASVNNRGEVVGGDEYTDGTLHAFLWTRNTGLHDLGTLGADVVTAPTFINNHGQVVGFSCPGPMGACRAYVGEDKEMTDLNTLIPLDSPLYLQFAYAINDVGEIVGQAMQKSTGELHAFLAIPCDRNHADLECCRHDIDGTAPEGDESTERPTVILPENARKQRSADLRF